MTVSLNTVASNLVAGVYASALLFTNQTDQIGQSRQFVFSVVNPPIITLQPTNQTVLEERRYCSAPRQQVDCPCIFNGDKMAPI